MNLDNLKLTYEKCLKNENYKFKDLDEAEQFKMAARSFKKITPDQQVAVQKSWAQFIGKSVNDLAQEDVKDLLKYRFLAQTNLFFLCLLLGYSDMTETCHEPICNSFFVNKNPTVIRAKEFANTYQETKKRMLLTPRGAFKSTCNLADIVQWIICFPEVTILILSGTLALSNAFIGELKGHFQFEQVGDSKEFRPKQLQDTITGEWTQSAFQVLFQEHCVEPEEGLKKVFQTPACKALDKEPTVMAASIEQSLSGFHFFLLKLDDVVTNENALTVTRLEAVNKQISINRAMLHPYGFFDAIGTWYDKGDYYGKTITQQQKQAKKDGLEDRITGSVNSGRFNIDLGFRVYLRAAWWPTEAAAKAGLIEEEMTEKDKVLFFPERLTFQFLKDEQKEDPEGFPIKYLNNPSLIHQVKFPRELLLRRTIPHNQLPQQGMVVTTVDTAYSLKSWADFTVIMTAMIFGGRFYIIDMERGKFNEFELPAMIAAVGLKWKPKRIVIEDSTGVKWMSRELRREMDKLQISIPVEYASLGTGSKKNSKEMKAKPVLKLLHDERMLFSNSCKGLEEIYSELEKFGHGTKTHDDIVSTLSILAEQFSAYADSDSRTVGMVDLQFEAYQQAKEREDLIFGTGRHANLNTESSGPRGWHRDAIDDNPTTNFLANQQSGQVESFTDYDPLAEIFS